MANRLREIRNKTGHKLLQITAQSHVSTSTLSAIERYDYNPRDTTKVRIASALNVPVEEIWPPRNGQAAVSASK